MASRVKGISLTDAEWAFLEGLAEELSAETNQRETITLAVRHLIEMKQASLKKRSGGEVRFKAVQSPKITLYRSFDTSTGELGELESGPLGKRKRR